MAREHRQTGRSFHALTMIIPTGEAMGSAGGKAKTAAVPAGSVVPASGLAAAGGLPVRSVGRPRHITAKCPNCGSMLRIPGGAQAPIQPVSPVASMPMDGGGMDEGSGLDWRNILSRSGSSGPS